MGQRMNVGGVASNIRSGAIPAPVQNEASDGPTHRMSARAIELDRLWRFYRCTVYDGRKYNWNGKENLGHTEHDLVARTGHIPPGFYDAGGAMVPIEFRKPSAPFFLPKVIVNRFTSLLFSAKRHPKLECDDPETGEWLQGFAEASRLWQAMIQARQYGGAMGSVAVGFKFIEGRPLVEVHDPRWLNPQFKDRATHILGQLEKLYQFCEEVQNPETGEWEERWFWYRRIINERFDCVWPKVPAQQNEAPQWGREHFVQVEHNFGFCPVVWIQNLPVEDSIDGDPDCHGIYELAEAVDVLWSQCHRGTVANLDPSVVISSDAEFDEIKKGSGNALQVERGASVTYMEMTGSGVDKGIALAEKLEKRACHVARVVISDENKAGGAITATEVEHDYSSMTEQADILREQYGEKGVKPLLQMVLAAAHMLSTSRVVTDPTTGLPSIQRSAIKVPKKKVLDPNTGKVLQWQERQLGNGEELELHWPNFFTPSAEQVGAAVGAAAAAKEAGLVDQEHAVRFVAEHFQVENEAAMLKNIELQQQTGILPPVGGATAGGGFGAGLGDSGGSNPANSWMGNPAPPGGR